MTAQEFQKLGIEYCKKHHCSKAGERPCPLEDHMMCIQGDGTLCITVQDNHDLIEEDFIEFAKQFNLMVNEILSEK